MKQSLAKKRREDVAITSKKSVMQRMEAERNNSDIKRRKYKRERQSSDNSSEELPIRWGLRVNDKRVYMVMNQGFDLLYFR
jgi:hypothetical protein